VPFGLFEAITQIADNLGPGGARSRVRVGAGPTSDPAESMAPPPMPPAEPESRERTVG
jgi:hypothetical protein